MYEYDKLMAQNASCTETDTFVPSCWQAVENAMFLIRAGFDVINQHDDTHVTAVLALIERVCFSGVRGGVRGTRIHVYRV